MIDFNQFLKANKLFAGLSSKQIAKVVTVVKSKILEQGDIICYQGDEATELYIIMDGEVGMSVKIDVENMGDGEHAVASLGTGAIIGEMALIINSKRSATVQVLSNQVNLLVLPIDFMQSLKDSSTAEFKLAYYIIIENLARELCYRINNANVLLASLLQREKVISEAKNAIWSFFGGFNGL